MSHLARGNALRVVDDRDSEPPKGDPSLTLETMSGWKQGQRTCRARKRHNWGPFTVYEHRDHFEVVEQCSHCRNRRTADFSRQGRKLDKWRPDYRDGYLLPRGAMRIDEELHDELMLSDILSRRIIEVPDDNEE